MTTATTKRPWEMSEAEYHAWYNDTFGENDSVPYVQRVSKWKQDGKITNNIEKENDDGTTGELHTGRTGRERLETL